MLWALVVWTVAHVIVGVVMQGYCLAGSLRGKLTPTHDADLANVALFWHFLGATVLVAAALLGVAPRLL